MKKIILIVFNFMVFLTSCTLSKQEKEPNDNIDVVANRSFNYTAPFKIKGSFQTVNDVDYLPIKIDEDNYYSISISNIKGIDSRITLLDGQKQIIIISDDYYSNFGEYIPMIYLKKGRYFIRVEINNKSNISYKSSNQYTVYIKPFKLISRESKKVLLANKPANKLNSIQKINFNLPTIIYYNPSLAVLEHPLKERKIIDYMSKETKKDLSLFNIMFYTFSLNRKGDYLLNMNLSAVNDFDPIIALFDIKALNSIINSSKDVQGLHLIRDDNEFDIGESILNYPINGSDQYIIAIIARSRLNYRSLDESQRYYAVLDLNSKLKGNSYEREPNNTIALANPITSIFTKGSLDSIHDEDIFKLQELPIFFEWFGSMYNNPKIVKKIKKLPTYAHISLASDNPSGLSFDILNSSGEILKTVSSFPLNDYSAVIRNFYIAPKTSYFIRVKHANPQSSDETLKKITHYQLEVNMNKRIYSDYLLELEPNDFTFSSIENASQKNYFRHSVIGYINNKRDIDNYFFEVKKTGIYRIELEGVLNVSFIIKIFNSNILMKTITTRQGVFKNEFNQYLKKGQTIKFEISPQEQEVFNPHQPYVFTVAPIGKKP